METFFGPRDRICLKMLLDGVKQRKLRVVPTKMVIPFMCYIDLDKYDGYRMTVQYQYPKCGGYPILSMKTYWRMVIHVHRDLSTHYIWTPFMRYMTIDIHIHIHIHIHILILIHTEQRIWALKSDEHS